MSFARSKHRVFSEDDVKVSFADVAGVDEAEQELKEIVEFLKTPEEIHHARRSAFRRACCWSARREPARRCSRARSRARQRSPSSA